jgi:hypothetical protein
MSFIVLKTCMTPLEYVVTNSGVEFLPSYYFTIIILQFILVHSFKWIMLFVQNTSNILDK